MIEVMARCHVGHYFGDTGVIGNGLRVKLLSHMPLVNPLVTGDYVVVRGLSASTENLYLLELSHYGSI